MKAKWAIVVGVLLLLIAAITSSVGIDEFAKQVEKAATNLVENKLQYAQMDKFVIAVIRHNDVLSQIDLTIALEVFDEEDLERVKAATPRLRNAIIRDLSLVALWPDENGDMRLALGGVKKRLLAVCEKILGAGVIRDLLVQNLVERKL